MNNKTTKRGWEDRISNHAQLGGIETSVLDNGPGRGTRIAWVDTGSGLRFKVVIDRAMDIAEAFHNNRSLAWISHGGVTRPNPAAIAGTEWLRSFGGGLLTTCGLSNIGPAEDGQGEHRGMHGRISNLPAELVGIVQPDLNDPSPKMSITGITREHRVFGPNLEIRRTISAELGQNGFNIRDEVTNRGNVPAPHMLLYHFNCGWPLVDEGTVIFWKGDWKSRGMDMDNAIFGEGHDFRTCPPPMDAHAATGEACGFMELASDREGYCSCGLHNPHLDLAMVLRYEKSRLPAFANWQHWGRGEYVTGLEPGTNAPIGQNLARERGELIILGPGECRTYEVDVGILTDPEGIAETIERVSQM